MVNQFPGLIADTRECHVDRIDEILVLETFCSFRGREPGKHTWAPAALTYPSGSVIEQPSDQVGGILAVVGPSLDFGEEFATAAIVAGHGIGEGFEIAHRGGWQELFEEQSLQGFTASRGCGGEPAVVPLVVSSGQTRSLWCNNSPGVGLRDSTACRKALLTTGVARLLEISQPTTLRLHRSRTTAR